MSTTKLNFAIIQLEHNKQQKIVVRTDWIVEFEKVKSSIHQSQKYADPVYFFYHNDQSVTPTFSISSYSKTFNPDVAACYKGYIANTIFGEH